jgi:hypothetical protein
MVPCTPLMAHWFNKRLSLAQGFANAGSGAGALILANTTRVAIDSLGIRWALIINGLVSLALVTPAIFLARGLSLEWNTSGRPTERLSRSQKLES